MSGMHLTRNTKQTVAARLAVDRPFVVALLDEAATLFLNGDHQLAGCILLDLAESTLGPALTTQAKAGALRMDEVSAMFRSISGELAVKFEVRAVDNK